MGILRRLIHPGQVIHPSRRRWLILPHTALALISLLAATADRSNFASPLAVMFTVPVNLWVVIYSLMTLAGIYTIVTSSWLAYGITNLSTLFISLTYCVVLTKVRVFDGAHVNLVLYGLCLFPVVLCLIIASTPTRVIRTR